MKTLLFVLMLGISFNAAAVCSVECYYLSPPPVVAPTPQPVSVTPQVPQTIQSSQIAATNSVIVGTTMAQVFNTPASAGQPKPSTPVCK